MKVKKIIYKGFKEFEEAKKRGLKARQFFGKYQYIFNNELGEISLIYVKHSILFFNQPNYWEIYCLKGKLLKGSERYPTKEKAVKQIKKYLKVDDLSELIEDKIKRIKNDKRHTKNKGRNT